ncbi:exodeoxyribonuclease VII small subunit [Limnobacter sp.]|uniref:exodeoxyribonuclease VII small subunit n=1 Tax=Limnobacter sp. TaxID=2003368 RepID=UPI003515B1D9
MSTQTTKTNAPEDAFQPPESFEAAMAELESLVAAMDNQQLGLDALLTDYKRGAQLVKYCRDRLSQVREEVQAIESSLQAPGAGEAG